MIFLLISLYLVVGFFVFNKYVLKRIRRIDETRPLVVTITIGLAILMWPLLYYIAR